jgi:hypothetical protein
MPSLQPEARGHVRAISDDDVLGCASGAGELVYPRAKLTVALLEVGDFVLASEGEFDRVAAAEQGLALHWVDAVRPAVRPRQGCGCR